jgi:hypothetical protein
VTESAPENQPGQDHGKAAPGRPRAHLCLKTPDELSMLAGLKSILECFLQALAVIARRHSFSASNLIARFAFGTALNSFSFGSPRWADKAETSRRLDWAFTMF